MGMKRVSFGITGTLLMALAVNCGSGKKTPGQATSTEAGQPAAGEPATGGVDNGGNSSGGANGGAGGEVEPVAAGAGAGGAAPVDACGGCPEAMGCVDV